MSEKNYHNYPDKNVTKKELCETWFPMSQTTLNRRLKELASIKKFRDVVVSTGGKLLINVKGFYLFLDYRQNNKFRL